MVRLLRALDYKKMPWKNGKGSTAQIAVFPEQNSLTDLSFSYRLSSAPITEKTVFSNFPGFSRILLPTQGKGFFLNGALYETFEVAHFSGDEETQCELLDGTITDLGLIYDTKKVSAHVKVLNFKGTFQFGTSSDSSYYIYVLRGGLQMGNIKAAVGETLQIHGEAELKLIASGSSMIALFTISPV